MFFEHVPTRRGPRPQISTPTRQAKTTAPGHPLTAPQHVVCVVRCSALFVPDGQGREVAAAAVRARLGTSRRGPFSFSSDTSALPASILRTTPHPVVHLRLESFRHMAAPSYRN